jgi:hypothetical protein
MSLPSEYNLFVYIGRAVKNYIIKNTHLSRFGDRPEDGINVSYASPPRAFAKFLVPVINGQNLNPTITFYLSNIEYAQGENLLGFATEKSINLSTKTTTYTPAPIICRLTYKIMVMVANELDADILQYQLMAYAPFKRPYAFAIDGQWATGYIKETSNDTNIEPGDIQDKVSRRSLDFIVPRAYLPLDYGTYTGLINEINLDYEFENSI